MQKNSNTYKILQLMKRLDPEEKKRMAEILKENASELSTNFDATIEKALKAMVAEKPNPNLTVVYDKVKSQNALERESNMNKIENQALEKLLNEASAVVDRVEGRSKAS